MKKILIYALFVSAVLYSAAVTAQDMPPSIEEYNHIKKGVFIVGDVDAKKNEGEELVEGVITEEAKNKKAMTIDEMLVAYKQGKYKDIIGNLQPQAESGLPQAEELLGIMYKMGQGVDKDPVKAFEWLSKSADAKLPLSQHHIGVMYYTGEGTNIDVVKALVWLRLASLYYTDDAGKARATQDYNNLIATATRRDKTRSQELLQEWLQQKGDLYLLK